MMSDEGLEQEGVIKFQLHYTPTAVLPLPVDELNTAVSALNAWRTLCLRLGVIGQNPTRYEGYGFGNISQRRGSTGNFLISGTQTGHLPQLTVQEYALVTACDPAQNAVWATGTCKPSSEAMTHAILYRLEPQIGAIIHGHDPAIWQATAQLGLPQTDTAVAYGTPAMAAEVTRLWQASDVAQRGIFTMGGHEDGVVAFGPTLEAAGAILVQTLVRAWQLGIA
jgi:ribulose-5-phosphate 4-epimerase/fuculose-1-phosphate aldolase